MVGVLDGRNDLMEHLEQGESDEREDLHDLYERKKYQVSTKPIVEAKILILDILLTIADLRDNYRMLMLLQIFQKEFNDGYYSKASKKGNNIVSLRDIQNILQGSENVMIELANLGSALQHTLIADDGTYFVLNFLFKFSTFEYWFFHHGSQLWPLYYLIFIRVYLFSQSFFFSHCSC
jgi:hypothetical protein